MSDTLKDWERDMKDRGFRQDLRSIKSEIRLSGVFDPKLHDFLQILITEPDLNKAIANNQDLAKHFLNMYETELSDNASFAKFIKVRSKREKFLGIDYQSTKFVKPIKPKGRFETIPSLTELLLPPLLKNKYPMIIGVVVGLVIFISTNIISDEPIDAPTIIEQQAQGWQ